jgi:hypothetical protein
VTSSLVDTLTLTVHPTQCEGPIIEVKKQRQNPAMPYRINILMNKNNCNISKNFSMKVESDSMK